MVGELDASGDYQATEAGEDDTTSMVSMSTEHSEGEWETDGVEEEEEEKDGRRTPTQRDPFPESRESTPVADEAFDPKYLAKLLDPRTPLERNEARMLARHLSSDRILTRSRYQRALEHDHARVLTCSRFRPQGFPATSSKLTPEEEEQLLERFIIEHRARRAAKAGTAPSDTGTTTATNKNNNNNSDKNDKNVAGGWASGAAGMGDSGPQCVVCQSNPRTILIWPCRCLTVCEECRISLALKNFSSCVCCRRDVAAFSRLYVP